jgi:hypothetical protein
MGHGTRRRIKRAIAVPLEELLDIALDRVPELIFDALNAERN